MVVSAKSALLTVLTYSALAAAAALPPNEGPSSPVIRGLTARPQEGELEAKNHASVKLVSSCHGCVEGVESNALFDLVISSTDRVCGETNVSLNNKKLPLHWDGDNGRGRREVVADMANGLGRRWLTVSYKSVCVKTPHGSIEEDAAQLLTVTFHTTTAEYSQEAVDNASGFAVSFNSVSEPEILNLVNSRVDLPEDADSFDEWLGPTGSQELRLLRYQAPDVDLEAELKDLESLMDEAARLDDMITEKDRKIRMRILDDCRYLTSELQQCDTWNCMIKTSFKKVPDVYRLMKYRFGSLPSSLAGSPCNAYLERKKASNTIYDPSPWNITEIDDGHSATSGVNSTSPMRNSQQISKPSGRRIRIARYFFPIMAGILIVNAVVVMFLKYCYNSLTWQRKRAELAARREERRAVRAYRRAAWRYRWKQWWASLFSVDRGSRNAGPSQDNLTHPEARRAVDFAPNPGHNMQENGSSNMGAEILGLRRVFEYVGGLVRYDGGDAAEAQLRQRPNRQDISELYGRRVGTPTPSSIAPLTTIGSPRASSVLTYETDSMDTVDSLDTETVTIVSA